ncbi:hypothetical protein H0H92_011474, partial [Tricholoma furcatifolium]
LEDGVDVADEFELPDPFSSPLSRLQNLPDNTTPECGDEDSPAGVRNHSVATDNISRDTTPERSDEDLPPTRDGYDNSVPSENDSSSDDDDDPCGNPFFSPLHRVRPSDYLRLRCPLCFGGEFPESRQAKLEK